MAKCDKRPLLPVFCFQTFHNWICLEAASLMERIPKKEVSLPISDTVHKSRHWEAQETLLHYGAEQLILDTALLRVLDTHYLRENVLYWELWFVVSGLWKA